MALEAASTECLYAAPSSAPFGGFCPRLRPLCDGGVRGNGGAPFRRRGHARPQDHGAAATTAGRHRLPLRHASGEAPGRRMVQPPCCVPHRHARRRDRGKTAVRSDAPPFPPFRRRETIFRAPGASRCASPPHAPRRPRLAATPCGVSAAGWEDCRHGVEGWGKCGACFLAARTCGGAWILGSSPRMTERRRGCQPLCRCGIRLPCFSPNPLFFRHPRA